MSASTKKRIIFHIDFDYFFAQCEELRRPELKGKPIVVCVYSGRTEDSGAVSTANYEARKYDVRSGISIKLAKNRLRMFRKLCCYLLITITIKRCLIKQWR